MSFASIREQAEKKYPAWTTSGGYREIPRERAAYIQGRLDQAEADAQIAESEIVRTSYSARADVAAAIREAVAE